MRLKYLKEHQGNVGDFKILLADDCRELLVALSEFIKSYGFSVDVTDSSVECIEKVRSGNYDVLILDYFLPEINGGQVVNAIRKFNKDIYVILNSAYFGNMSPQSLFEQFDIQNCSAKEDTCYQILACILTAYKAKISGVKVPARLISRTEDMKILNLTKTISRVSHKLMTGAKTLGACYEAINISDGISEKTAKDIADGKYDVVTVMYDVKGFDKLITEIRDYNKNVYVLLLLGKEDGSDVKKAFLSGDVQCCVVEGISAEQFLYAMLSIYRTFSCTKNANESEGKDHE